MTVARSRRTIVDLMLIAASVCLQWSSWVALRVCEFGRIRRTLDAFTRRRGTRPPVTEAALTRISWAVRTSSAACVPVASCVTEAIAAVALTRWLGFDASLTFGVQQPAAESLTAHAWAVSGGKPIVGGETGEWAELRAARTV